jgi:glycosyltransferase involved in cell wall biosynthesis
MKIAIISSGTEPLPVVRSGSVDNYAYNVAKNLAELGEDVTIFANYKSKKTNEKFKLEKIYFPVLGTKYIDLVSFNTQVLLKLLLRKFDVIHTNLSTTALLLSNFFNNIVFTSHSAYWWRSETTHYRQIEAARKSKTVIAISKFMMKKIKKYNKNVTYIPNGVDTNLFKPISFSKKKLKSTILSVGGITEQKGLIYLAKVMPKIVKNNNEIKWIHVGPGNNLKNPYYKLLTDFIKKENLSSNIIFTGPIPLKKLVWYYQNASLFVLPSLWEGMPLVVLEAISSGLPIVASDIAGVNDLLSKEFLVKTKESKAMTKKILWLITDKKKLKNIGMKNRIDAEANYSWHEVSKKLLDVYRKTIF